MKRWDRDDRSLKFITDPSHLTAIETVQPYNRCTWSNALARINNSDKHRLIQVTVSMHVVSIRAVDSKSPSIAHTRSIRRAIRPDGIEVEMDLGTSIQICLPVKQISGVIYAAPVVDTLHEIKTEVANLLEAFKPAFQVTEANLAPPPESGT
jgi:hypothetical protein